MCANIMLGTWGGLDVRSQSAGCQAQCAKKRDGSALQDMETPQPCDGQTHGRTWLASQRVDEMHYCCGHCMQEPV
jgi:hypothetical protein